MIKLTLICFPTSHAKDFLFGPKKKKATNTSDNRGRGEGKNFQTAPDSTPRPPDQSPENTQDNHRNDLSSHPKLGKKTHGTPEPSGRNTGQDQPAFAIKGNVGRPLHVMTPRSFQCRVRYTPTSVGDMSILNLH